MFYWCWFSIVQRNSTDCSFGTDTKTILHYLMCICLARIYRILVDLFFPSNNHYCTQFVVKVCKEIVHVNMWKVFFFADSSRVMALFCPSIQFKLNQIFAIRFLPQNCCGWSETCNWAKEIFAQNLNAFWWRAKDLLLKLYWNCIRHSVSFLIYRRIMFKAFVFNSSAIVNIHILRFEMYRQ